MCATHHSKRIYTVDKPATCIVMLVKTGIYTDLWRSQVASDQLEKETGIYDLL